MSQDHVERLIGKLVTDEAFRRRFAADAASTLQTAIERGAELNRCELRALIGLAPRAIDRFAGELDPCIQKADLRRTDC